VSCANSDRGGHAHGGTDPEASSGSTFGKGGRPGATVSLPWHPGRGPGEDQGKAPAYHECITAAPEPSESRPIQRLVRGRRELGCLGHRFEVVNVPFLVSRR